MEKKKTKDVLIVCMHYFVPSASSSSIGRWHESMFASSPPHCYSLSVGGVV